MLLSLNFSLPFKDPVIVFFIVLFIIFLAPVLLKRLRIPSIIGLILAGVAIGPHGFHLLDRDSSIVLFGTVGLLYIMFLAGLELDLVEFRKNRTRSMVFGGLTFIVPLSMGFLLCFYLLDFSLLGSVLVSSMFATHTLVAYPITSRLGLNKNEAVTIAVGGTIITDTIVLLILAILTNAAEGKLDTTFLLQFGISIVLFAVVVFFGFPIISRWFFKNVKGDSTSQYIFVLAMVFLGAFLAELAGVEPIIGAFLAGLALNRLIPHSSSLMNRIEFVGNAIFIPFFLISVGMLVDLKVLFNGPAALIIAGSLTAMALLSKFAAAWITGFLYKFKRSQIGVLFGLSSAHAAATLAVILIGYELKIVDENVLNGTILLILITCLTASFVTENNGRKLAIIENQQLPDLNAAPERILIPIRKEENIEKLLELAQIYKQPGNREPIFPLAVVDDDEASQTKVLQSVKMLEKAKLIGAASDTQVEVVTRVDLNPNNGITRAIKELVASDLLLAYHDKFSPIELLFGNSLDQLIQRTGQTITVARLQQPLNTSKKIIVLAAANAELEKGFPKWLRKVQTLSKQLGTKVVFFVTKATESKIREEMEKSKLGMDTAFRTLENWEDHLIISREAGRNDLIIGISARRGSLSYVRGLENIAGSLDRHFQNNFLIIYPEQEVLAPENLEQEGYEVSPISENIERITQLGRTIKNMLNLGGKETTANAEEEPVTDRPDPSPAPTKN